jgi:hypothetical protein
MNDLDGKRQSIEKRYSEEDEAFWQKLVLPRDESARLTEWKGRGYRWFRSPNVICLEHYRRAESLPQRKAS